MDDLGLTVRRDSGLEIGRGSRRIVCIDAASCFADAAELVRMGHDPEAFNAGIHGHMFTRPGDIFVFSVQDWDPDDAANRLPHLLELNARVWREQTGIELVTFATGKVEPVERGASLLGRAVELFDPAETVLVPTSVTANVLELLGVRGGPLSDVAESCERLNRKNTALQLLASRGVPVPHTVFGGRRNPRSVREEVSALPGDRRYVLKADGLSSGLGVHLGDGSGCSPSEVLDLVESLRAAGRLPTSLQVQEFVTGSALGALAHFDGDGRCELLSIALQRTLAGRWVGAHWEPALQARYGGAVLAVFERIAATPDLRVSGPVGFDAIASDAGLAVIEVNARHVGSRPIGWLLANEARLARHRLGSHAETDSPAIRCIDLDTTTRIRPDLLKGDELLRIVKRIVSDPGLTRPGQAPPMVLPQGLDPARATRLVFVNDETGRARARFVDAVV